MSNIIDLVLKSRTSEASAGVSKLAKSMNELKSASLLSVKNFVGLVKQLSKITDYTDSYTSSVRLLKTTLGGADEEATNFINKLGEMSGISTATLTKQTAKFIQLGESLSFSNEQAEKFSENLSILSTKLAMLYNTDYESMANALQKAVQGSQVTLKSRTGISINDMSMQATLNANAIDRQVSSLNDAEKALVRYATILRQVTNDTSVYQNAVNSLAWQKQMLSYQMKKLAAVTGQLLTPALTQLYIIMNGVLMAAIELVKALGKIFNIDIDMNTGVSNLSDSYDDLGTSISGASKAAKKSLRGFDQLNNITTPTAGGGGGALGIDSSLLKLLDQMDNQFLDIENKATEIKNKILGWLGINEDLSNAEERIHNIWTWVKSIGGVIAGVTLAQWLGLSGREKFGLAITLGSIPFYLEGIEGIANGKLTSENFMKIFASSAGLGVGVGMLTGSWKLGIIVTLVSISWAGGISAGEWIKQEFPDSIDWYIKTINLDWDKNTGLDKIGKTIFVILGTIGDVIKNGVQNVFGKEWGNEVLWAIINSIAPLSIIDNIADIIVNGTESHLLKPVIDNLKDLFWLGLKSMILYIAKKLKKIPVIGTAIGTAIENGIKEAEKSIEKTTEKTTINAIENATPEIEDSANETGDKATSSYISGMKERFDLSREDLTKKIEETMNKSSTNADKTFKQTGDNNGTTYTKELNSKVSNNQPSLTGFIQGLISMAGNTAKRMFETKGKDNATDYNSQLNNNISGNQSSLTTTIKNTISNASTNAEATAKQSGLSLGNKEMTEVSSSIRNSQTSLKDNITTTIRNANNSVDTSSGLNVGENVSSYIRRGFDRTNLGSYLNSKGETIGEDFGDSISDNMQVNNRTLGRTLNSALSSVITKIRSNNWNIFGSGGLLSNLLKFNWTFFADGGFPKEGDFFFANEAGPELVGTMNNHPAVANNDQIVKGIQSGVFSAMMSALDNTDFGGSNVTIEATGDTEGLLDFIEFKQKQKSRQFN